MVLPLSLSLSLSKCPSSALLPSISALLPLAAWMDISRPEVLLLVGGQRKTVFICFSSLGICCWDVCAGACILEEAGGVCIDPSGAPKGQGVSEREGEREQAVAS